MMLSFEKLMIRLGFGCFRRRIFSEKASTLNHQALTLQRLGK
jgi:hypothetical protein